MRSKAIPVWKKAPFIRLLLPLISGILLQWYLQFSLLQVILSASCFSIAYLVLRMLPISLRFTLHGVRGIIITLLLICLGSFITWQKDIRHHQQWYGNSYSNSDHIAVTINEPLIEKNRSFKAEGITRQILRGDTIINTRGKIILYFEKDSANPMSLKYGDKILFHKNLQRIKNTGNPGAFDYRQYSAFHQIHHTVFLKKNEWVLLKDKETSSFRNFLFNARDGVIKTLRNNLPGNDDQRAIAEALLIGYTHDLDKDLVQAYSNTGVVHIIAISGMHLGLIYIMLMWLFRNVPIIRKAPVLNIVIIISCLWLFAFVTGGSASILRAAVMFSCIIIGKNLNRRSSIYNSLAASAFILLCYNPYYLWDVGFQLSYLAMTGIGMFQNRLYRLFYIKNILLDKIWQLSTLSIAAQLLTSPVCLYYFHQFPTLFLFTNIILVPLSSLVLFVEIFLVALAWLPWVGVCMGKLTWWLIWVMNKIILWCNDLPFAVWNGISITVISVFILYGLVLATGYWLVNKSKIAFRLSLVMLFAFTALSGYAHWKTSVQQKIVVYNINRHRLIDFINGNIYASVGDTVLQQETMLHTFHVKPARIALHLYKESKTLPGLLVYHDLYQYAEKKIFLAKKPLHWKAPREKIKVDYIIISNNPNLSIPQLARVFNFSKVVFDGSNSLWKIAKWKKECEQLHLRCYSVPEEGAFVLNL